MIDKRCVVQFLHPGPEPDVRVPGEWRWNAGKLHKRKFLVSPGEYRATLDGPIERSEQLAFWGEWEPQSSVRRANVVPEGPAWIHEPYYTRLAPDEWAQNTDPFVFGEQFHFTGCQQHVGTRPTQLAFLAPGSLILFGSAKKSPPRFLLDTVFVVGRHRINHNAPNHRSILDGEISSVYRDVTIDRWYSAPVPPTQTHRLYFGATPERPHAGMFSFFPCRPFEGERPFARPAVTLAGVITPSQTQKYKLSVVGEQDAALAWRAVAAQVISAGLALGVRAEVPPCVTA